MLKTAELLQASHAIQGHVELMQHFLTDRYATESMVSLELLGRCNLIEREIETLRRTLSEREPPPWPKEAIEKMVDKQVHHHRRLGL